MDGKLMSLPEMREWYGCQHEPGRLAVKLADAASECRQLTRDLLTRVPLGIYLNADGKTAMYAPAEATEVDSALLKSALAHHQEPEILTRSDLASGNWIKVGFTQGSPFLHSLGEYLNFFKGHYPGGFPNQASPVNGMLTRGLLGAGLGYGAGALGEYMLPNRWQKGRLRKTLALAGMVPGAVAGTALGVLNMNSGLPFNSDKLLAAPTEPPPPLNIGAKAAADRFAGETMSGAVLAVMDALGPGEKAAETIPDIDTASLNRSLWDTGADPRLAGMTMGAVAAAQQMPGGREPGFVTPMQMASMAAHMGAGWLSGALVGSALGILTGMPEETQKKLRDVGMYTAIVREIIPRLYGS